MHLVITGQPVAAPLPIGAKRPSVKASAKPPSGVIGAPIGAKAKAKSSAGKPPAGTASTAKQDTADQQDANITPDSALEYLAKAPADQTFADFQENQGSATVQDVQPVQDAQAAQDSKAASDTRAAQSTQSVPPISVISDKGTRCRRARFR